MRMWGVPPQLMCRKHLLGEHVEMHMFAGTIVKGINIQGYLDKGLVDTDKIKSRHDDLAKEMERRGYNHKSPLEQPAVKAAWSVNIPENIKELARRCPECRDIIADDLGRYLGLVEEA